MITTAGQVRAMLAGLTDDEPVFADLWTAGEMRQWIEDIEDAAEDDGGELDPVDLRDIDLKDASMLRRALACIPNAWETSGDDMSEMLTNALIDEFFGGGEE